MTDCRVPAANLLPASGGLKSPLSCLTNAREVRGSADEPDALDIDASALFVATSVRQGVPALKSSELSCPPFLCVPSLSYHECVNLSLKVQSFAHCTCTCICLHPSHITPQSSSNASIAVKGSFCACLCIGQGIAWGITGAALDCYECALDYGLQRQVFNRPLAGYQLFQAQLADMASGIVTSQLMSLHYGRLKDAEQLSPVQVG